MISERQDKPNWFIYLLALIGLISLIFWAAWLGGEVHDWAYRVDCVSPQPPGVVCGESLRMVTPTPVATPTEPYTRVRQP